MKIRIDRFLCHMGIGSRSEIKKYLKTCRVKLNGKFEKNSNTQVDIEKDEILFDDIETGDGSYAILFRSSGDVYALFVAPDGGQQTLADVVTMSKNMGITIGKFYLPDGDLNYFYRNGVKLFKQAFPSLYSWNKKDVKWYSLQVPYSPALVKVASVNGEVRRFDKAGRAWQKLFDYSFRKVRVHYERG